IPICASPKLTLFPYTTLFRSPQISRGRADQLGNLMRMLKFRAINLDHRTGFAKENLGSRFHNARLSRAGWPEKQKIPYRAAGRRSEEHTSELQSRFDLVCSLL